MLCKSFLVVLLLATIAVAEKGKKKKEEKVKLNDVENEQLPVEAAGIVNQAHYPKGRPPPPPASSEEGTDCDNEDKKTCIKRPGTDECFHYNRKNMAATADEAVLNFFDLSTPNGKQWVPTDSANANGLCQSNTCKGCMQIFIDQLERDLPMTSEYSATRQSLTQRKQFYGLNSQNYRSHCTNLQNVTQPTPPPNKINTDDLVNVMTSIIGRSTCEGSSNTSVPRSRQKRQGGSNIGTVTAMNCNYRRGNNLNDGSSFIGLCNLCNAVRTLPSQYFPRYINELSCQSYDNKCLSGYGTCRERYRSIEVLINYGTDSNPRYAQYSVNTPVGCECQVQAGSALSTLASG